MPPQADVQDPRIGSTAGTGTSQTAGAATAPAAPAVLDPSTGDAGSERTGTLQLIREGLREATPLKSVRGTATPDGETQRPGTDGAGASDPPAAKPASEMSLAEFLKAHPKGDDIRKGLIGQVIKDNRPRLEAEIRAQIEQEQRQAGRATEFKTLIGDDPYGLVGRIEELGADRVAAVLSQLDQEQQQAAAASGEAADPLALARSLADDYDNVIWELARELPADAQARLQAKTYGDTLQGRADALKDILAEHSAEATRAARAEWDKTHGRTSALLAQNERLSAAASHRVDRGGGAPATADVESMSAREKIAHAISSLKL